MKGTGIACVGILVFLIAAYLGLGALTAFLWNEVIVGALHFTDYTLDLWTGVGLYVLISIIGGAFRSSGGSSNAK
jgi:hypothetical protein